MAFTSLSQGGVEMEYKTVPYRGKVLIINDTPSISNRIAKWLRGMGYYSAFVDSDDDSRDLWDYTEFDTILYGHEFLLKKNHAFKFQPILKPR